jgi:hypothetical protein
MSFPRWWDGVGRSVELHFEVAVKKDVRGGGGEDATTTRERACFVFFLLHSIYKMKLSLFIPLQPC